MKDLVIEAFDRGRTKLLTWEELTDYCLGHTLELITPLLWPLDRDEIFFLLLSAIRQLENERRIRTERHRGYIQSIELLDAMPILR
jgi:hypothetical protein